MGSSHPAVEVGIGRVELEAAVRLRVARTEDDDHGAIDLTVPGDIDPEGRSPAAGPLPGQAASGHEDASKS